MRSIKGPGLGDFAGIYDNDVEIVSVPSEIPSQTLAVAASELLKDCSFSERWVQAPCDGATPLSVMPSWVSAHAAKILAHQVFTAAEMIGVLMGCKTVGLRLATLAAPMCPRFHVDYVPCRLLLTFTGSGTEWIAHGDVDWDRFHDFSSGLPPHHAGCGAHRVDAGVMVLLKGGNWDPGFPGVVHRSPPCDQPRVLLSVDPILD